ncbi:mechanosensitive ion channel family protein [Rhodosalinus halophilus]|uniref:Small-conductance mechanosensitive channel n=2 Tax=Rhodosalinus halophilus TaxID=2259333 RepID=A0A365UED2_9RHOB|nr:mechanosensitive ion channel family protein [Rhodosalinus halophilus]
MAAISAAPAVAQDGDTVASEVLSAEAEPYPPLLAQRSISLPDLQLRLVPLTVDQLSALAAAWQDHARAATQDVVDKSIEIRAADSANAEPLRAERLILLEERATVFDKLGAVVLSLETKGGDPAEVATYRNYITAVTVEETSRWTFQEFADSVIAWAFSSDGGGQLLFQIAVILVAFFALLAAARFARGWVRRVLTRVPNLSKLLQGFLVMIAYWLTLAFGLMLVLAFLGVNITPLFALVGGASFIIAFALQDTLGNLASGLMIMINRPFDEGDFVSLGGVDGTVQSVSIVSTKVITPDNRVIVIPNSKVWGDVITNTSASDIRRIDLVFGISYDDSIQKAQEVIEQVVADYPAVLDDPAPVIRVNELSASSVDFICRPWVKTGDYLSTFWDLTRNVKEAFDANGITIPFPQTEMHLHVAGGQPMRPDDPKALLTGDAATADRRVEGT